MGGRGSNSPARLVVKRNVRTTQKKAGNWKRTTAIIADRKSMTYPGYEKGNHIVYKDDGGRFRVYDIRRQHTLTQGKGADLTFNKLADAKKYAESRK